MYAKMLTHNGGILTFQSFSQEDVGTVPPPILGQTQGSGYDEHREEAGEKKGHLCLEDYTGFSP